jgi:ABC-type Fe3+-hydroxamate transport system substrate-binding protein
MSDRVIVRNTGKKYELSTEQERETEWNRIIEELQKEKPDTMIIVSAKKKYNYETFSDGIPYMYYTNWCHGAFSIKILAELVKEFENAYAEIIKKGYELHQ